MQTPHQSQAPVDSSSSPRSNKMAAKIFIVLAGLLALSVAYKLDITDVELKSALEEPERALKTFQCLLGKEYVSCDGAGRAFKDIFQDVINSDCGNCSPEQDKIIGGFFARASEQDPEKIKQTLAIYDPSGENFKKHAPAWRRRGIKV